MISQQIMDKYIIEHDLMLPGLSLLLESKTMWSHIGHLPEFSDIESIHIKYLRYKPATSCVATMLSKNKDGSTHYYFVKALTQARFADALTRPKQQAKIESGNVIALQQYSIFFTNPLFDRYIPMLKLLRNEKYYDPLFRTWLPDVKSEANFEWHILRYKPERRAVIQILSNGKPLAVLRITSAKEFGRILLGSSLGAAIGEITILAADAKQQLLVTSWTDGESLDPELGYALTNDTASDIGKTLANIHNIQLSLPLTRTVTDEIQAMNNVLNTLSIIYPHSAATFHLLASQIAQGLIALKSSPTLIHGDFSADQIIKSSNSGRLTIIDWERATYGNPVADLATFRARLEMQEIEKLITQTQANEIMAACLKGYTQLRNLDTHALMLYSAWALLCLAIEPFRKRHKGWPQHIDQLLIKTANIIAKSNAHSEKNILLNAATDLTQIETPLVCILGLSSDYKLKQSKIIHHKINRRALIQYQLEHIENKQSINVLGKYNTKGVNNHSFNNQLILWQNGFNDSNAISVPEPLGILATFNLWLQRKVIAQPLTTLLLQPNTPYLVELGNKTAQALVKLHTCSALQKAIYPKRWRISDELNTLRIKLTQTCALLPHLSIRINKVLKAAECLAMSLNPTIETVIHRDFYTDQVMIGSSQTQTQRQIYLIDFDLCCLGNPALDAGNYLAHIQELALRHCESFTALLPHEHAFKQEFLLNSPHVSEASLNGFTTLSLARHIFLSTQFNDRNHTTESLLTRCEQLLQC